jgi:hypothetical protein
MWNDINCGGTRSVTGAAPKQIGQEETRKATNPATNQKTKKKHLRYVLYMYMGCSFVPRPISSQAACLRGSGIGTKSPAFLI